MAFQARCARTLPLRVEPLPGEAIDSWLEAVARTHRATFGSVLDQCGIDMRSMNRQAMATDLSNPFGRHDQQNCLHDRHVCRCCA